MVRRKHWKKDWHHRAPDFKLVYCGPKKSNPKEETRPTGKRIMVDMAVTTDRNGVAVRKLEKKKYTEEIEQWH